MDKIIALISGKKTYLVAGIAAIVACLQIFGVVADIPEGVWILLNALGLGAVRDAISKVK